MSQAGGFAAAWEHGSCQNDQGGMTGDEAMRAAEGVPGKEMFQSSSLDWLWHTEDLVVKGDGRTGSHVNLRHDDTDIGAVICDEDGIRRLLGLPRYLPLDKVFLTWERDKIGQGGLGIEQHGSRRRAAQGWASIGARH